MTKFITRRREVDAIQIPSIVGRTPQTYLEALTPVIEFLTLHAVRYTLVADTEDFDWIEIDGTPHPDWVPNRSDWLVADTSSENHDLFLYTDDEFQERFMDSTSMDDVQKAVARAEELVIEGIELREQKGLSREEFATRLIGDLTDENLIAHDDARDLGETVLKLRERLIEHILTVWAAIDSIRGGGQVDARTMAVSAVGTLVDTLHGREWSAAPASLEDDFGKLDLAIRTYPQDDFALPVAGWFLVRDHADEVDVVTAVETNRVQLLGMAHAALRKIQDGRIS